MLFGLILILSIFAVIAFLIGLAFLIVFIVKSARKSEKKKGAMITFIVALCMFLILASIDTYVVWTNRAEIIGNIVGETAEYSANALGTTAGEFGKYYDKTIVKRIGNMDIEVESSDVEVDGDDKIYTLSLAFNNKNEANEKIYMHLLVENHYLVGLDSDDFVYDVIPIEYTDSDDEDYYQEYASYDSYDRIPVGKTRHIIQVYIPKNTDLAKLRFLDKEIPVPKN